MSNPCCSFEKGLIGGRAITSHTCMARRKSIAGSEGILRETFSIVSNTSCTWVDCAISSCVVTSSVFVPSVIVSLFVILRIMGRKACMEGT